MKVSIVVNNYQYVRYVGRALQSALSQTWPDVEVVCVDDGSTDGSREAILACGPRVRPVFQPNGGQGSAYNAGFAAASGDIVMFLDADDWLYPDAVERIVAAWRPGVSKVQFRLDVVDADGRPRGRHLPGHLHDHDALDRVARFGSYGTPPGSGNAFDAAFLRRVLPMDASAWRIAADSVPILLAPAYGDVVSLPVSLGAYRVHRPDGDGSLLFNNAAGNLWREYERLQRSRAMVGEHLQRLGHGVRRPVWFAPWDARLVALCLRFGGPAPESVAREDSAAVTVTALPRTSLEPARVATVPAASRRRPLRLALARRAIGSLWRWPGLGLPMKLLQSLWMLGLWTLPAPLARPIGRLDRLFKGAPHAR